MVRSRVLLGLLLTVGSALPMLANPDTTSLQSILTNVDGITQTNYTGYNTGAFDQSTGLGTLTFTFNPGAGSYFFDVFFDHRLNLPFFNEFGTVLGSAAAGQLMKSVTHSRRTFTPMSRSGRRPGEHQ